MRRSTFIVLGFTSVTVGVIGAFLPILPSTIFFILAAACFARSSPKLEKRILDHPVFGPPVISWRDHGAIPSRAKMYAVGGMIFGYIIFFWTTAPAPWLAVLVAAGIASCAIYVMSRPSGPKTADKTDVQDEETASADPSSDVVNEPLAK